LRGAGFLEGVGAVTHGKGGFALVVSFVSKVFGVVPKGWTGIVAALLAVGRKDKSLRTQSGLRSAAFAAAGECGGASNAEKQQGGC
jgi:hypothetical protein